MAEDQLPQQQQPQQQPQGQGFDWLSLAANILPAVAGGLMGARNGAYGAIPGALYGLGNSARFSIEDNREREKLNADIAQKNAAINQNQQRIGQEDTRIDLERQNYARLNKLADEQVKNYELDRKKTALEIQQATTTQDGQQRFRDQLPPDKQAMFDADPNKSDFIKHYYADQDWAAKTSSSSTMLQKMGLDANTAQMLGPVGTAHLLGTIMESRLKPRDRFAFHYDTNSGMGFMYNKETGTVSQQQLGDPKQMTPEKRSTIMAEMRKQYAQRYPMEAKLATDTGDWSKFDEWSGSPSGQIVGAQLSGQISMDQANLAQQSITRQERDLTAQATDAMRKSNPKMSDQQFQDFMKQPKAAGMLEQWKGYVKQQNRGPITQPTKTTPGAKPTAAANKRPSLDQIFGG